ncbi:MAG: alanine racemase [Lachnospiraceae bacterium]|nr:alanine racemase [Lachnospiraceae bacterium]
MENYKRVYAEVNLDNIIFNLESMKNAVKEGTSIMAVIKADGYGHGALMIADHIKDLDYIAGFAVATIEEAVALRENGIEKPILILGYTFPDSYEKIVELDIRPAVFKADQARALSDEAVRQGRAVHIHLAVDTGMSRIGVRPSEDSLPLVKGISELPGIDMEGIFTHFAKADETDKDPTYLQLQLFNDFIGLCEREGVSFKVHHASNSAGIVEFPEANLDMVRAGITLYGLYPSNEVSRTKVPFKSALELKSHIVYIKYVAPGREISYGGTYKVMDERKIATIPVGYGDGYPRLLSNKGWVLIHGKKAPILGRVCMDQFMVDVTDIPDVAEYDEVTLIGRDGHQSITMEDIGELSGRFNYELACDLSPRIPKVYIKDGKVISVRETNYK